MKIIFYSLSSTLGNSTFYDGNENKEDKTENLDDKRNR